MLAITQCFPLSHLEMTTPLLFWILMTFTLQLWQLHSLLRLEQSKLLVSWSCGKTRDPTSTLLSLYPVQARGLGYQHKCLKVIHGQHGTFCLVSKVTKQTKSLNVWEHRLVSVPQLLAWLLTVVLWVRVPPAKVRFGKRCHLLLRREFREDL